MNNYIPFPVHPGLHLTPFRNIRPLLLLALLAFSMTATAEKPVDITGRVILRSANCFNPEPHVHEIDYFLLEDNTNTRIRLKGDAKVLAKMNAQKKVRIKGKRSAQPQAQVDPDSPVRAVSVSDEGGDVLVEEIVILDEPEAAAAPAPASTPQRDGGGNALTELSCLLIFASTNSHACMTSVTNATNLLFDNTNNANAGMQAITKGRYGLVPYDDGNAATSNDHIIEITLNIDSSEVTDIDDMEARILAAVFGTGLGQLGKTRLDYDRILLFPPGGFSGSGFTAFAYYPYFPYTTRGMVSMYGDSYGDNRMNGYLHELGHNFGFRHSSKGGSTYGDRTCVMGLSNDSTKTETYNVVKLMQTDWLDAFPNSTEALTTDMTLDLYPLSSDPNVMTGTLGVSIPGTDYYVAYHRDDRPYGYLSQSGDRDRVFVYTNTGSSDASFQVANLGEGDRFEGSIDVIFGVYGSSNAYATVSIDILDGNDIPTLPVSTFGTGQNAPLIMDLTGTDEDVPNLSYAVVESPATGSLSGTLPTVTYTPKTDFTGSDSFRIKVSDSLISNFITVTVLVFVDTDTDGMEDSWEIQYFGDLAQGPTGNPDNDQENNLTEFQNGSDPSRAPTFFANKLSGTIIGTSGSYANDPNFTKEKALDGDLNTYYDAANAKGDWVGLDLGSPRKLALIKYAGRAGNWGFRLEGGMFQVSNTSDFSSGVVTLYTISGWGVTGTLADVPVNDPGSYRYVRYIGSDAVDNYNCAAELEFYADGAPTAPTGLSATSVSGAVYLDWNDNSENDLASYKVYRGTTSGTYDLTPIATGLTQSQYSDTSAVNGTTYSYVVSAEDNDNLEGANSAEASVEYSVNDFTPVANAGEDQSTTISGAAAWTPALLTTAAWYDASDAGTLTESGGAVSQWNDKSPNGLHLQAAGGQEPLTGSTSINGNNAIDFDGTNDQMSTASNPFDSAVGDALVLMVHKVDNDSDQGTLFTLTGSDASGSRWQAHAPYSGTVYFDCGGTGGANRVNTNYGTNTGDNVLLGFYGSTTDNMQQIYKNGSLLVGDSSGHNVNTVGNIFVGSGASSSYQDTTIGELIIVKGTVSLEDRQKLEGYLAHKWGLEGSLPVDHPYKAAPPGGSGASVDLAGSATDADGNPMTYSWTKVSGTGTVSFSNASALNPTATFSEADTYVLRLTADDGVFQETDDITITVTSSSPVGGLLVSQGPSGLVYETYANEGQTNKVNTVPDYSRAGYGGGGVEIPFVGAKVTLTDDGHSDDTARIQAAIDTVEALSPVSGFRGAVLLEAGNYTVSSTLNINESGLVIRGQGQQETGGTTLTYTATTQSNLFHFHGASNPAYVASSARDITDTYVPVGAKTLTVTDATPFAPGDLVRIRNKMNQQWIDDIGMTVAGGLNGGVDDPAWDPADFQLSHYRYITAVNGNELTLDAPIVQVIEDQYGGGEVLKYTYTGAIENVGIENIRLESTYTADDDEDHGWVAVEMRRVKNGWARQVTARYFGMGLILVDDFGQFITVEDSACLDPKSITTGGRKYSFNVDDSSYNLVQRTLTRGGRHDYATGSQTPGPNVFVDGHATQANSDIGPHFRYATGELYDNIKSDSEINVQNRLNAGTSHGWAGAQIMFWNVDANSIISDAPTGGMNWSIGTVGTQSESPSYMSPWEPFGIWQSHNTHVAPRSLYYAQLEDRLGLDALRDVIVPEQEAGTIWTELQTWDGDGLFLDGVICWVAGDATLEVDTAINLSSRIRELTVQENLSSTTWSKQSGPGNVIFESSTALATTATFDQQGTYVLHMVADDGINQVVGTLTLEITDPNYVAPPLAPTGLVATAGDGLISLDWDDNGESNVTYTLYRSLSSGSGFSQLQGSLATSAYTDNSVSNGTPYFYIVTASVPGSDVSENSSQVSAVANAAPGFDANPVVEAGATEDVVYSSSLADNATDDDGDDLTFRLIPGGPDWLNLASNGDLSGTPDSSELGLNEWTVQVDDPNGGSAQTTLRITVANVAPDALTGLSASAGNNSVTLNWPDSAESDFASYTVFRSTTPGSGYTSIATGLSSSANEDTTASNDTTYYYVVRVVDNGSLVSADSNEVSATPEAPSLVQIIAADNTFIQASGPDTVQDVSSVISVNRGAFIFGAREAFIRIPLSGDDEVGGIPVDEIAAVSLDLLATTMIANDTLQVYALLDSVQYSGSHLTEASWTGGTDGTNGNLTPNNRPDGGGVPNANTTISLGSITFPASPTNNTLQQISISDLDTFKQLIHDDTNGEITLILRGSVNSPTNSFISVFNGGANPKPTLSVERTSAPTLPVAASDLIATGGAGSIDLTWTDNSNDETGFIVQRSTTSGSGFVTITTTAADVTSFSDSGLEAGTEYFYQVVATNAAGDSAPTHEASATTWTPAEAWRNQYFSSTSNNGNGLDTYDFDEDGVMNLLERAFGTIPNDISSFSVPTAGVAGNGGTPYLSITYRRLRGGTGTTGVNYIVDGMVYTVEYTGDLTTIWNSGNVVQVGTASDNGDGTETVTVRTTSGANPLYLRVHISTTP
jgi:fibronectin type 3 domain-containing protein